MLDELSRSITKLASRDLVVYTAIIKRADELMSPSIPLDADFICITDLPLKPIHPWKIIRIQADDDSKKTSRRIKITLPNYIPHKHSIWIDGGMRLVADPLLNPTDCDIALHRHFHRHCAYDELRELVVNKLIDNATGIKCTKMLLDYGYQAQTGLYDASFIYRASSDKIAAFNNDWLDHLQYSNYRDQPWLNYLIKKHNLTTVDLLGKTRDILTGLNHHGCAKHYLNYTSRPVRPWL